MNASGATDGGESRCRAQAADGISGSVSLTYGATVDRRAQLVDVPALGRIAVMAAAVMILGGS